MNYYRAKFFNNNRRTHIISTIMIFRIFFLQNENEIFNLNGN